MTKAWGRLSRLSTSNIQFIFERGILSVVNSRCLSGRITLVFNRRDTAPTRRLDLTGQAAMRHAVRQPGKWAEGRRHRSCKNLELCKLNVM